MSILKFLIAGNVDDGKSTLTGRLLLETNSVHEDLIQNNISLNSKLVLSHFSDGLKQERLQGITIDVSYKFFSIGLRKFVLIDAPGHFKYVKNLVSGASQCDLVLIIIDVLQGITDQTIVHFKIAEFLNVSNVIFVINKMDLINYESNIYLNLVEAIKQTFVLSEKCKFIPISALVGDNITSKSMKLDWFNGPTLISMINDSVTESQSNGEFRMQISSIIDHTYYAKIISGSFNSSYILNSMSLNETHIGFKLDYLHNYTSANRFVKFKFSEKYKFKKGEILYFKKMMISSKKINTSTFWMSNINLDFNKSYIIKIGTSECKVRPVFNSNEIKLNSFNKLTFVSDTNIIYDKCKENFYTSRGIIIDIENYDTVGVFVILK